MDGKTFKYAHERGFFGLKDYGFIVKGASMWVSPN